jgi:hypothetical protein
LLIEQFRVIRKQGAALLTDGQGLLPLIEVAKGGGQQGIELAGEAIVPGGPFETLPQVCQCLGVLPQGLIGPAQVEEDEGVIRVLGKIEVEQAQVPLVFVVDQGFVLITLVADGDIGPVRTAALLTDGCQDLLMHPVVPANPWMSAEETHLIGQAVCLVPAGIV